MLNFVVNSFPNYAGTINSTAKKATSGPFGRLFLFPQQSMLTSTCVSSLTARVTEHSSQAWKNRNNLWTINKYSHPVFIMVRRHMWECCHVCYQATSTQMTWGSQKKNSLRQHAFLQSFCSVALQRSRHFDEGCELVTEANSTCWFPSSQPMIGLV